MIVFTEMTDLESHPLFNPEVKISGIEEEKVKKPEKKSADTDEKDMSKGATSGAVGGNDCDLTGFSMFQEEAAKEKPKS